MSALVHQQHIRFECSIFIPHSLALTHWTLGGGEQQQQQNDIVIYAGLLFEYLIIIINVAHKIHPIC